MTDHIKVPILSIISIFAPGRGVLVFRFVPAITALLIPAAGKPGVFRHIPVYGCLTKLNFF